MTVTKRLLQAVTLSGALVMGAQTLDAQACFGLPSLSTASSHLSTSAAASTGRTVLGRYSIGTERVFVGVQGGYAGDKLLDPRSPLVGGDIGVVLPLGATGKTQLCPVLHSLYQRGPNSPDYSAGSLISSVGLSLGRTIDVSPSFAIVPFAQGSLVRRRDTFSYTSEFPASGGVARRGANTEQVGRAGAGIGLRFNDVLTVTPALTLPFGFADRAFGNDPTASISASWSFRR